jgi:D-sedoheptulose 7-phosphate isomerase
MISPDRIARYFDTFAALLHGAEASAADNRALPLADAFVQIAGRAREAHGAGNKLMFIGNGGSAGIASHMAIDYSKNGRMRSLAFNDGAALTCLGNDLGYDQVFAKQVEMHGRPGDVLIAISSSGRSPNILNAVSAARVGGIFVATLSGFDADNPLRRMGDVNLYIASHEYGFVEIGHAALCHAVLDLAITSDNWGDA